MQINRSILRGSYANIGDYAALTKPRLMSLAVFTALVGLIMSWSHQAASIPSPQTRLHREFDFRQAQLTLHQRGLPTTMPLPPPTA